MGGYNNHNPLEYMYAINDRFAYDDELKKYLGFDPQNLITPKKAEPTTVEIDSNFIRQFIHEKKNRR